MRRVAALGSAMAIVMAAGLLSAAPARAQDDQIVWWAIGDSYSSGEGIPGTEPPTDGAKECARASGNNTDAKAWAVVARETLKEARVRSWAFTPCTGAVSSDVSAQITEAAKASGSDRADIVTLSMGGNDIYFADVVKGCIDAEVSWNSLIPGCNVNEATMRRRVDMLAGRLAPEVGQYTGITLPKLYDQIAEKVRPGGTVIVLGYPQVVEEVARWDGWRQNFIQNCEGVQSYDIGMLRSIAGYLNQQIAVSVQSADKRWSGRGIRFHWRDISTGVYETDDDPAHRHALCSRGPWINGVSVGATSGDFRYERSFHPNQLGHRSTGVWLGNWIRTNIGIDKIGRARSLDFRLDGIGPVRLDSAESTAIADGQLAFKYDDVCPAEIDSTTTDDSYVMPGPEGADVTITMRDGRVFSYRVTGSWTTAFGVSKNENVYDVADRYRGEGWDVTVSDENDIFGPGRLEAVRGDDMFTIESDEEYRAEVLVVPRPIYCD